MELEEFNTIVISSYPKSFNEQVFNEINKQSNQFGYYIFDIDKSVENE